MALPTITEKQARSLAGGPFAAELLKNAATYVVPIGWVIERRGDQQEIDNGTAFFLQTKKALFGVTAKHVVEGYRTAKAANANTVCHLMDTPFDLNAEIISLGGQADIATFKVSEKLVADFDKQACTAWPPMMPQPGKGINVAGYPGRERVQTGDREHNFGLYCAGTIAQEINSQHIVAAPFRPDEIVDTLGKGLPSDDYRLGGMSGAPVLTLVETGLVSWRLG